MKLLPMENPGYYVGKPTPPESQVLFKNFAKHHLRFTKDTHLPCEFLRSLQTYPGLPSPHMGGPQWRRGCR